MSDLTKEYFDKHMAQMNRRFDAMDTRLDVMQAYMDRRFDNVEKEIHDLARMTAIGFSELEKRLDVRERLETLEKKMTKVETALNVRL